MERHFLHKRKIFKYKRKGNRDMNIIKYCGIILIFIASTYIGKLYANKYKNRVDELEKMKSSLNIFKAKIKFTCNTIPEIFEDIGKNLDEPIGKIFLDASKLMEQQIAKDAWDTSLNQNICRTNFNKKDIEDLKELSKMLGNTDVQGQISQIELVMQLIEGQTKQAQIEMQKNSKLYRTLGITAGLTIAIILI